MADDDTFFVAFGNRDEFTATQAAVLSKDLYTEPTSEEDQEEWVTWKSLIMTFHGYQEQAYLLDPYLEGLVAPVVERLKSHAKECVQNPNLTPSENRVIRVAELLYQYTKFRGYKAIIRFFPHEVADVSVVLDYTRMRAGFVDAKNNWALRYVLLLWLSLICRIPFDLSQLDEPGCAQTVVDALEEFGKKHLDKAGLEREGAALLLSRLYMRKDTGSRFHDFVEWSTEVFHASNEVLIMIGIQQVIAEVAKSGPSHMVKDQQASMLALLSAIEGIDTLKRNSLVRKYRAKIWGRVGLRLLPNLTSAGKRRQGKMLDGTTIESQHVTLDEVDVPEEIEPILDHLFESLQDKDTIVRWSSSKAIARIAENLPDDFATQILETLLGLFSVHSVAAATMYDMPSIAEATWHGACLACAEMARRNLIPATHMSDLVAWLSKALYFDIRKGAHSIGSNVRDAAAYVLWALARTQDVPTLAPHASTLANHLVSVAIYDREIHIRRAASAAYQEHVGRTNLFPHGIDVLSKTDFYSVSVRKHSFAVAAVEVARHEEYRYSLLHHVLDVVLRHWDVSMRETGAQSLRNLCQLDLERMTSIALPRINLLLESLDPIDLHGGLLALAELGVAHRERIQDEVLRDDLLQTLLGHLTKASQELLTAPRNHLVTAAACRLIAATLTKGQAETTTAGTLPLWRKVIDVGMKHRQEPVQDAAAEAVGAYSALTDVTGYVLRVIKDLSSGSPVNLQSLAKIIGALKYTHSGDLFPKAVECLLEGVKITARSTIETRRAWLQAVPAICATVISSSPDLLSAEVLESFISVLLNGFEDYTVDERGDVGSWARVASIQGLTLISELLLDPKTNLAADVRPALGRYLEIIAAILKQGVERLDNVRSEAGNSIVRLLRAFDATELKNHADVQLLKELFLEDPDVQEDWAEASWIFPRATKLLDVPTYREGVLSGAIISIGSKTDSTHKAMSSALANYVKALPISADGSGQSLETFVEGLLSRINANVGSNKVVLPIFQTFNVLLEEECLEPLTETERGRESLRSLTSLTTRAAGKLKSVQRILESMKIFTKLLAFTPIRDSSLSLLGQFLAHTFPKIRFDTAEYLYLQLQTGDYGLDDTTEIETVLLETRWSAITQEEAKEASDKVVELFTEE